MPSIREYFADAKITPSDRGSEAWEQAGRRIGNFYEQMAQGMREEGQDIAKLWNEAKASLDLGRAYALADERRGGGGGGGGRGNVHDALDFGRPFAPDSGANGFIGGQNESSVTGYGRNPNTYNVRAAREIGAGAASLPALISKVMNGQGLTDQQWQVLGTSPSGVARLQRAQQIGGATVDYGKNGIQPNPEPTDEQLQNNGFSTDTIDKYGQFVPEYPTVGEPWFNPAARSDTWSSNGWNGYGTWSSSGAPSTDNTDQATTPAAPAVDQLPAAPTVDQLPAPPPQQVTSATQGVTNAPGNWPTAGQAIWAAIQDVFTPAPAPPADANADADNTDTGGQ